VSADPNDPERSGLRSGVDAELGRINPETDNSAMEIALRAGAALARPVLPRLGAGDVEPYAVVPVGHTLEGLARFIPEKPRRTRQTVKLSDLRSFVVYVARFRDPERSLIYTQEARLTATAILDHPAPGQPDWGQHRAVFTLTPTPAWTAWLGVNGRRFGQVEFAEWVENHLPDIADPTGGVLLEMVKQLDIRKAVQFESSIRLDNGQTQLTYVETVTGSQAKSTATIPETFILGLIPFEGADQYKLTARLRYRLTEGKVALWFELLRPGDVVRDAWSRVVEQIGAAGAVPILGGEPPDAA